MSKEERTLESFKAENDILKSRIEELEDLITLKRQKDEEEKSNLWSSTLTQDEIDDIVASKIAQEIISFYNNNEITETKMVELVIDFVNKGVGVYGMSDDFKTMLSLGHRTQTVLADSIYTFLKFNRNNNLFDEFWVDIDGE